MINNNPQKKTQTNKDRHCQLKMINHQEQKILKKNDLEDTETTKTLAISNLMPKLLLDDGIAERIMPLYS